MKREMRLPPDKLHWRNPTMPPGKQIMMTEVYYDSAKNTLAFGLLSVTLGLAVLPAREQDQTVTGAGNATAITLSNKSSMVQSAKAFLLNNINKINDARVRAITIDAIANPSTCVASL